jgi:hypothetical protein
MSNQKPACIHCGISSDDAPLIYFKYRDQDYWICSQHLPILIHEPFKLAEHLPGTEKLKGHEH